MTENSLRNIEKLLASEKPEEVRRGLQLVKEEISRVRPNEAGPLYEMVSTIFYIDPLDRPDLLPVLDEAVTLVSGFGKWVIPILVENLDLGDIKVQMAIAHTLGRMGTEVIAPLIAEYQRSPEPARRTFILYGLSKVKSAKVVQAAGLALEAAGSPNLELRVTATRALGKFAESIPKSQLTAELRRDFIRKLRRNLPDPDAGIRAKAVRSLGKLAKHGHLNAKQRNDLKATLLLILGEDENYDWDRAYVVRREAKEALEYV